MTITDPPYRYADLRLPPPRSAFPTAVRRAMLRAGTMYGAVWLVGFALALTAPSYAWRTLGLGLALPGGGFLAGGHVVWGVVTVVGFVFSLLIWWAIGPTVLPPLVWVVTAGVSSLVAGSGSGTWAVLAAGPALIAASALSQVMRHRSQTATGKQLNEQLAEVRVIVTGPPALDVPLPVSESSEEDLARLRYGIDLALQPLDSFEGFANIDQFREGALRYQLNALSYGLSMSQFTRTPAFTGYLAEAQRNAINKMLLRKTWGYWAIENAWGNCSLDKDPVDNRDNIMLTGFFGLMIGMYESLNDDRFSEPGGLTFTWDEKTNYAHDFGTLASSIHRNMNRSNFALFACEPNWIYTVCNTFGLNTLMSHDRLHGTEYVADVIDRLAHGYDNEFLRPDGRIIGVRSRHLGLSWNFWASPAVQMATTFWLHPALPDISLRTWWLLRESSLTIRDGKLELPQSMAVRLDPGSYKLGRDNFAQACTILAAQEIGDDEYAAAARATLEEREEVLRQDGVEKLKDASGLVNHYLALGRFGRKDGLRDIVAHGAPAQWRTGPVLAQAAYPDVLVASAVTDGKALDLVLYPGAGPIRTALALERLVPRRTYAVSGAVETAITADDAGRAMITVEIDGRRPVRVH